MTELVKADLHNHFRTSSVRNQGDFNKAINMASKRLGKGGIFGVVNFADERYEHFVDQPGYSVIPVGEEANGVYVPEKEILVVKGQEVPTEQGHLLVVGIGQHWHLENGRSLERTLDEAKDFGGIVVADHPFHKSGVGKYLFKNPHLLERFDAIEIHNGEVFSKSESNRAKRLYEETKKASLKVGILSSSDGHSFYEAFRSWTAIKQPELTEKARFIQSLRESIRSTNLETPRQETNSPFGLCDHALDLIAITLLSKVGFKDYFSGK